MLPSLLPVLHTNARHTLDGPAQYAYQGAVLYTAYATYIRACGYSVIPMQPVHAIVERLLCTF